VGRGTDQTSNQGQTMTKEQALEIIKLLSALESWSFAQGNRLPDYLHEQLCSIIDQLSVEVLK
jgi:hypothetical protein